MSLINQMLKDLEKRRSRDLETSESLSHNITWETRPGRKTFNWLTFTILFIGISLCAVVAYLLWERTVRNTSELIATKTQVTPAKKVKVYKKPKTKKAEVEKVTSTIIEPVKKSINVEAVDVENENISNAEHDDSTKPATLTKTQRPLNNKQLAEIAYNKGYKLLQQGRMRQGKEHLREALALYKPHIKAREMLAGIFIKSGHFVDAAELLDEGVKLVRDYPLFAQLYARVLLEQNNPKRAIEILERGSVAMEVSPDYYALLAATYQRVKNHKKAVDIYLQLVKIRPSTGIWWLGLAISLEKSGKNKEALEAYQRAQQTGNLKAGLVKFTNNRVSALTEIGFPES